MEYNQSKFGETVYFLDVRGLLEAEVKNGIYLDPKSSKSEINSFIQANEYNLYIMLNTWTNLAYSLMGERSVGLIRTSLNFKGIYATIKECSDLADAFFSSGNYPITEGSWVSLLAQLGKNDRDVLQVLLFPKHFSVEKAPVLLENSLNTFKKFNSSRKILERRPHSYDLSLLQRFRDYFAVLLSDLDLSDLESDYGFTGGTINSPWKQTGDINKSPFHKMAALMYDLGELDSPKAQDITQQIEILSVPKSYKTYRIIGRNSQLRNCHAVALRRRIEACSRVKYLIKEASFVSLYDADLNYDDAIQGSFDGSIATLDLSSASDSFTWTLLAYILPNDLVREMRKCLSPVCRIEGVMTPLYIAMPMGIPYVQLIQSLFYHVAKLVAIDLDCFGWTHPSYDEMIQGDEIGADYLGHVHGDDITCSPELVPSLIAVLKRCRFTVNEDKSFWDSNPNTLFRESCGSMGVKGWDCSLIYYPRKTLRSRREDLESLVSLERRLWFRSEEAGIFLISEVTKLHPNFTTSKTSENQDLIWYWNVGHSTRLTKRSFIEPNDTFDKALKLDRSFLNASLRIAFKHDYRTVKLLLKRIEEYSLCVKPHENRQLPVSSDQELARLVAEIALTSLTFKVEEVEEFPMSQTTKPYSTKNKDPMEFTKEFPEIVQEILLYELYLLEGPRYEDSLCQLLNCSTSRRPDFLSGGLASKGWKK